MTPPCRNLASDARYQEIWSTAAIQVVRKLTGDLSWRTGDAGHAGSIAVPDLVIELRFSRAFEGTQSIGLSGEMATLWAGLLSPRQPPADHEAEHGALLEVLRQITVAVTTGLKSAGMGDTQIEIHSGQSSQPAALRAFQLVNGAGDCLELGLDGDAKLLPPAPAERPRKPRSAGSAPRPSSENARGDSGDEALGLLLEIELDASLRFGGCQMPLREIVDLAPGSVVELDRDVDDPVELLVGGKPVAWGEAVIVDGNYGFRVTRVANPTERMAVLRGGR